MNLSDLKPNPKNPRKITDKKLKALAKSMKEFGDLSGIVLNRRSGKLIGGHQRAQIFLAHPERARIHVNVDDQWTEECAKTGTVLTGYVTMDGERYSYREVDWDEDKEKAANIAANKGAGEWDWAQLGEWFLELDAANFDLGLTMFSESEIESALGLKEDKKKDEEPKVSGPREVICPDCGHEFVVGK